jgi:anti-anti-sigma factor
MNSNLRIDETTTDDGVTICMTGELDLESVPALEQRLAVHGRPGARLVIDLRPLNFMDAVGVDLLMRTWVESSIEGWTFTLLTSGERFIARAAI